MQIKRNILLIPGPSATTDTVRPAQIVPDISPREKEFAGMMKGIREIGALVHRYALPPSPCPPLRTEIFYRKTPTA